MLSPLMTKCIAVLVSCTTMAQLNTAMRYINLAHKREGITSVVAYHIGFTEARIRSYDLAGGKLK